MQMMSQTPTLPASPPPLHDTNTVLPVLPLEGPSAALGMLGSWNASCRPSRSSILMQKHVSLPSALNFERAMLTYIQNVAQVQRAR
jgi:hypothetical protein